ncbi:glycosyl transferase family protein [Massilia sp. BSC265]|uniref:glycosyl transferase family protein n=1 Tax=Massilia sp. BSC265 TaxID=1549812 RepID=UPI0009DEF94E|nr:glycosyl transferase family protein [Massilia sp. BSC265]
MDFALDYLAADYYAALELMAALVAIVILLSALDDIFIDAWYWVRTIYRRLAVEKKNYRPLTSADLCAKGEQPLAIMVPAWLEYDVIAAMIENMVAVLDYRNYVVFVGTYVNDAATIKEVERMRRRYKQLKRVEVPHPGPTCKADCLNWVVQAIFLHERETGTEFAGVILHDSEDVLHPLELRFFNYLLPRKDMIQLPVASLEREWYELVAGTYMDEFAESHAKDMVVRESVAGMVPSAGVGTCFSRRALQALCSETDNQPFNTSSLTEDYDIGTKLSRMGMQSIFAKFPVQYKVTRRHWFGTRKEEQLLLEMPLSVREYFPDTFRTAYRQKARWVLGIGLQSWEQIAWSGSLASRYLLLHDRKGIVTAFVSMLAYFLFIQFICFQVAAEFGWWSNHYPSMFLSETWWDSILYLNAGAFVVRALHRIYFVNQLYGWRHGLLSVPRMIVANFVNFMAVARAWKLFLLYLFRGQRLAWDKTMHDFPTTDQLKRNHQRLGELLQSWQAVDETHLEIALKDQQSNRLPLGRLLVSKGWLDDETLAEAIAYQADLPRATLDRHSVLRLRHAIPLELAMQLRALYIGEDEGGQALLAVASPLDDSALERVATVLGKKPLQQIVREGEIAEGLRLLRGDGHSLEVSHGTVPLLGDILIAQGHIERARFESALLNYRPAQHGRIGDYMVDRGMISQEIIEKALAEQRAHSERAKIRANDDNALAHIVTTAEAPAVPMAA